MKIFTLIRFYSGIVSRVIQTKLCIYFFLKTLIFLGNLLSLYMEFSLIIITSSNLLGLKFPFIILYAGMCHVRSLPICNTLPILTDFLGDTWNFINYILAIQRYFWKYLGSPKIWEKLKSYWCMDRRETTLKSEYCITLPPSLTFRWYCYCRHPGVWRAGSTPCSDHHQGALRVPWTAIRWDEATPACHWCPRA